MMIIRNPSMMALGPCSVTTGACREHRPPVRSRAQPRITPPPGPRQSHLPPSTRDLPAHPPDVTGAFRAQRRLLGAHPLGNQRRCRRHASRWQGSRWPHQSRGHPGDGSSRRPAWQAIRSRFRFRRTRPPTWYLLSLSGTPAISWHPTQQDRAPVSCRSSAQPSGRASDVARLRHDATATAIRVGTFGPSLTGGPGRGRSRVARSAMPGGELFEPAVMELVESPGRLACA